MHPKAGNTECSLRSLAHNDMAVVSFYFASYAGLLFVLKSGFTSLHQQLVLYNTHIAPSSPRALQLT